MALYRMNPAPSPSIDCVLLLLLSLLLLLLLLLHRNHLKSFHGTTSMYGSLQATISFNSAGRGDFGCLLSKCCLYVLGSGIVDIHTVHLCINAALADAFCDVPPFFNFACRSAFFCWDWIFC